MKKAALVFGILYLATAVFAGFKVKNIKPKKPEQFQSRMAIGDVTFAADLLIEGKDQKEYFYKNLQKYHNEIKVNFYMFLKYHLTVIYIFYLL